MNTNPSNLWTSAEHALGYLVRADAIPHRTEGEAVLLDHVPKTVQRILNLGTGDGRLLALLKIDRPLSPGDCSRLLAGEVSGSTIAVCNRSNCTGGNS